MPESISQLFEQEIISDLEEDTMFSFTEGHMIDELADLPLDDEDLEAFLDELEGDEI